MDTLITLSPLLGLLGTVTGIMGAFSSIGGSELAVEKVTGGIGEALIATAAGLGIAIFCLIPHNFFHRRAQSLRHDLEQAINQAEIALKSAAAAGQPVSDFQPAPDEAGRRR
jgi:biopolymer transport protein ExbB